VPCTLLDVNVWLAAAFEAAMQEQLKLGASVKEACRTAGLPPTGRTSLQYLEHLGETPSATARNLN
jgi:hypothetical protein